MTERQQRILRHVQPYLSELYQVAMKETHDRPVGWSVLGRVPAPLMSWSVALWSVHIVKVTDGFKFRVDEPCFWHRKGHSEPKWRTLHA